MPQVIEALPELYPEVVALDESHQPLTLIHHPETDHYDLRRTAHSYYDHDLEVLLMKQRLNPDKLPMPVPEGYDPYGEPRGIPIVRSSMVDDYATHLQSPWSPFRVTFPDYGRFVHYLAGKNPTPPWGRNPRPPQATATPPLDQPAQYKPVKVYHYDGHTVKDELGELMALVRRTGQADLTLCSPNGKPWMRYDSQTREVASADPNSMGAGRAIAFVSRHRQEILNPNPQQSTVAPEGYPPPSVMYEYKTRPKFRDQFYTYVYDGTTHALVATAGRPQNALWPSQMRVQKNVPHHLLLITLFLV